MKNKKIILPLVLVAIVAAIWASGIIQCPKKATEDSENPTEETNTVYEIDQKDEHEGHQHGATLTGEIPEESKKLVAGSFTQPLLCANQEALVFTDAKGNQLYYQENSKSKPVVLIELSSVGNNIAWSKTCENIYFKEKTPDYKVVIKSINVKTKEIKTLKNYPPLVELKSLAISDTIYYLDEKTLEVKAQYENLQWNISTKPGNYYKLLISPDNKYLVAHEGADILLFKTNGEFIRVLGRGIATDWNPNSKQLIGFLDESENGYEVSGSELYLYNIDSDSPVQLTFTPKAIEMWPIFKSTSQIIYTDEANNGLFVRNVNQK